MSGWNGIFFNGVFSLGFDFLPTGTPTVGGVFDAVNGSPSIAIAAARFAGGYGMQCNGNSIYIGKALHANLSSVIFGFAFEPISLPSPGTIALIATFYDTVGVAPQVTMGYNSQGQIGFYSGTGGVEHYTGTFNLITGTSLSATGTLIAGTYCYIEVLVTASSTLGVITCNVNGIQVSNFSGLNTAPSGNNWINYLYVGSASSTGSGANQYFDDWYMLDMTGSAPFNTFLGPGRIQTDVPNQDSATSGLNAWAFSTPPGSDYGCCDNIPANPAQYCFDSTVGDRMSFRFPALSTAKVFFMNTWYSAEEDSAGTRTIVPIFRNNSTDQVGPSPISLSTTFTYYNQPSTLDPYTGVPWASETVATASACEIGLKVNS